MYFHILLSENLNEGTLLVLCCLSTERFRMTTTDPVINQNLFLRSSKTSSYCICQQFKEEEHKSSNHSLTYCLSPVSSLPHDFSFCVHVTVHSKWPSFLLGLWRKRSRPWSFHLHFDVRHRGSWYLRDTPAAAMVEGSKQTATRCKHGKINLQKWNAWEDSNHICFNAN